MSAVHLRERQLCAPCVRFVSVDMCSPYRDVPLLYHLMARRTGVQVDVVQAAFLDVEEAERVGLLFPEGRFAEGAIELDPWL